MKEVDSGRKEEENDKEEQEERKKLWVERGEKYIKEEEKMEVIRGTVNAQTNDTPPSSLATVNS
ncbi:hypothetical protein E2C01_050868 [Portunus trituberculatus]|uniref:Uncharacterized protein n=1 Tax=Portunus trituberculatus TaxID=210409 RepID=A0A5B7GHM1_PORTR|nr:hypothetical protein [Portunus trituberculatus]